MALAEAYEGLGENEKALEIYRKSKRAENETTKTQQIPTPQTRPIALDTPSTLPQSIDSSLIHELEETKANAFQRTQEEHKRQQAEKEHETKLQFHRLELLYYSLRNDGKKSSEEFLRDDDKKSPEDDTKAPEEEFLKTARILFEDLKNHRQFFPRDKAIFYYNSKCWRKQMALRAEAADDDDAALEEQATTMAKRLQWQIDGEIGELEAEIHKKMTEFQGLTFAQWFDFSIKYIFIATTYGYEQEAFDVLRTVSRANVFYHNSKYKTGFKLLLLAAWGLYTRNFLVVCESTRWLCNLKPFDSKVYRLYGAGMASDQFNKKRSSGANALSCFASANSQKYFLRQVKSMDNGVSGDKKTTVPEKHNDALLALYGHILACARSYIGAIGYYARAYAEKPNDPLISISIGLAYLHRAMQRQTDNRHLQIMQGFTFLFNYYELKARNQEAEYNLGRAFHQL
ncbi:3380_t:CDS:2, partial [Gigaspora rosea]